MCNILSLLLPEGSLALFLVFKEHCALSRLSVVLVSPYFNGVRVQVIVLEERADVFRFRCKRQSAELQCSVVAHLQVVLRRVYLRCTCRLWDARWPPTATVLFIPPPSISTTDLTLPPLLSLLDFFELSLVPLTRYRISVWERSHWNLLSQNELAIVTHADDHGQWLTSLHGQLEKS